MKRVGLVFLGLVASAIAGWLLTPVYVMVFPDIEGCHAPPLSALLILVPIAFLIGSIVTGYFSYHELEDKWGLIWMAPALYYNLLFVCVTGTLFLLDSFIGVNEPRNTDFLFEILIPFLIGLYWYLASLAGVILGYLLRERFARWWYGD